MKKYESDAICDKCGQEYGNHQWMNDACPTRAALRFLNGETDKLPFILFSLVRRFKAKGE